MAGKPNPRKNNLRLPTSHDEWKALMQDAIARAEKSNDRRIAGLRHALVSGNIELHLKKLGIVSTQDLTREFPDPDE
jgi:hypothetical protein